jgi:anti-sigma factor RsiW
MTSEELNDSSADDAAMLEAMRATFTQSAAPLAQREAREKRKPAPKRQPGTRAPRKGHERTAQLNIKMLPAVKERLMAYCESQGIAVTDWMEEVVMSMGGN